MNWNDVVVVHFAVKVSHLVAASVAGYLVLSYGIGYRDAKRYLAAKYEKHGRFFDSNKENAIGMLVLAPTWVPFRWVIGPVLVACLVWPFEWLCGRLYAQGQELALTKLRAETKRLID